MALPSTLFSAITLMALSFNVALAENSAQLSVENKAMATLFDGPPALASTVLDPAAYVEEGVQKLTRARIAYVNWDAIEEILKELGISTIPKSLTPELSEAILSRAGFAKPLPNEPPDAYSEELRTLYSIRYGGRWINFNFGSGRNGASGHVDIKGIGKTALVRPWADGGHSSGGMGLQEAVKEAIWSNILHNELPLGANRVLMIITTGTLINPNDPQSEERAILVREDPIRPAYFQPNSGVKQYLMSDELRIKHTEADQKRMDQLLPKLIHALPHPKNFLQAKTDTDKLRLGFFEMTDRIAYQYAMSYTRQIVLAGGSTSNVEINGVALDYGVTTSVSGFPRVTLLDGEAPHGSTETLKNDIVLELAQDLREVVSAEMLQGIPSDEELARRLDSKFQRSLIQGFLELAGTPKEYSAEMAAKKSGNDFGKTLLTIAQSGNEEVVKWKHEGLGKTGRFELSKVIQALLKNQPAQLERAIDDLSLRNKVRSEYEIFKRDLLKRSQKDQITADSLKTYMEIAASARNRSLTHVQSGRAFFSEINQASAKFSKERGEFVQDFINKTVIRNQREIKSERPFEIRSNESNAVSLTRGLVVEKVFNLKTGQLRREVRTYSGGLSSKKNSCDQLLKAPRLRAVGQ